MYEIVSLQCHENISHMLCYARTSSFFSRLNKSGGKKTIQYLTKDKNNPDLTRLTLFHQVKKTKASVYPPLRLFQSVIQRNGKFRVQIGKVCFHVSFYALYLVISSQCMVSQQRPVLYRVRSAVDNNRSVLYLQDLDTVSHHR